MEDEKKKKLISTIQISTVVVYVLLVLKSTIGTYIKENKKRIKKEAKRKEQLAKEVHKKKLKALKAKNKIKK